MRNTHQHALWRSLEILGSPERLGLFLGGLPRHRVQAWLRGYSRPQEAVFLRAVDVVMADKLSRARGTLPKPTSRPRAKSVQVPIGGCCCARCPVCHSTDFAQLDPAADLYNHTELVCTFCELTITLGELLALAGNEMALICGAHAGRPIAPGARPAALGSATPAPV